MRTEAFTARDVSRKQRAFGLAELLSSVRAPVRHALALLLLVTSACTTNRDETPRRFSLLSPSETNVDFVNRLEDEPDFNILDYLYFYDGGGVALGDVNGDGLPDLFFTANQARNRLYLNRGGFRFEDVTTTAKVGGSREEWSTGAAMADVNGDGRLDIYVCQVNYKSKSGHNLLYINNGDGTFSEESERFGLDFEGLSTQAAFFDYDRDGDLDLYLLNHAVHTRESYGRSWRRMIDAPGVGDKLYRNDDGRFTDVTGDAGIYSSALGYGLGIATSDVNHDGWPDIYVGNDFHENDYLYINNGDGTFTDVLERVIAHTSRSSMGNDVADFNNDGRVDIVSLDMMPPDLATYRRSGGEDADELAQIKREHGFADQYSRNTLQLNRGVDEKGYPLFSEVGLLAGIEATDWSWAGLFADLDNDGWKDLYVTNGILRRPNDLDYIDYVSRPDVQRLLNEAPIDEQLQVTERMPSVEIANFAFRNNGDLTFDDRAAEWGLDTPAFSNGAAYGDLDNDGDLDLVVSNINEPAFIYRNDPDSLEGRHFLSVELQGEGPNTSGIGSKVVVHADGQRLYQEQFPTRGFQSSVSHTLHFGLGETETPDSLVVIWPDGRFQSLRSVEGDRRLVLHQRDAEGSYPYDARSSGEPWFRDVTSELGVEFVHSENRERGRYLDPLVPHTLTTQGPALAVADVNADGLDDFYIGGAHGQAGTLFIQEEGGRGFLPVDDPFDQDADSEDVDAAFFDADGDGDPDLYVVSGGGEEAEGSELRQDRLYLNDGAGGFTRSPEALPSVQADGCCVAPADYDADGVIELFVGSRSVPGSYGEPPGSYLLENDGAGTFEDVTERTAPHLLDAGMVTAAVWVDVVGAGEPDLVLAGEWMPVTVLQNSSGKLTDVTTDMGLAASNGWWQSLASADLDRDGDADLVAGNMGANSVFRPSPEAPLELFVYDFDRNSISDPVLAEATDGVLYTWARRDELLEQIPDLQEKIPTYTSFSRTTLIDLFSEDDLHAALRKRAYTFKSLTITNSERTPVTTTELPIEAQFAPIMDQLVYDFNGDGNEDLLTVTNFFASESKQGRYDAGLGGLLIGDGQGSFRSCPPETTGLVLRGESRKVEMMTLGGGRRAAIIARNDDSPLILELNPDGRTLENTSSDCRITARP